MHHIVTVFPLAVGFSPPARAADHAEVGDRAVLRSTEDGYALEAEAADPRALAGATLVRALRGLGGPAEAWEVAAVRRSMDRGEPWPIPETTGRVLSCTLRRAEVDPLRTGWAQVTSWHQRIPLANTPEGPVILAADELYPFAAGDVLVRVDGQALPPFHDMDRITAASRFDALRDGSPITLGPTAPLVPDWSRNLAPTCGPCCHGHCDDELVPYGMDVPVVK